MSDRGDNLKLGLSLMPQDFIAEICGVCEGEGQFRQLYTLGCGMGTAFMMGSCDWCQGVGVVQGHHIPASQSVVNQILVAAERAGKATNAA